MLHAPQGAKPTASAIKASTVRLILDNMRSDQRALGQHDADKLLAIVGLALDNAALAHLYDAVIAADKRHVDEVKVV